MWRPARHESQGLSVVSVSQHNFLWFRYSLGKKFPPQLFVVVRHDEDMVSKEALMNILKPLEGVHAGVACLVEIQVEILVK